VLLLSPVTFPWQVGALANLNNMKRKCALCFTHTHTHSLSVSHTCKFTCLCRLDQLSVCFRVRVVLLKGP